MGGSSGFTLPEDFDPVGEGWTPPVSVQRRRVVAPPADYRPGIDPEWNYFGSTLDPIDDPTVPVTDPIYTYPGIPPTYSPGWNPYDIDLGIDFQEDGGGFDLGQFFPEYTPPEIDYDLLAGAIDMPSFQMPDYTDLNQQLLDLQGGLGGLEAQFQDFQMPTFEMPDLDYDLLASNLAGNINMPSFEMPDYTQQFENLQTGLGGLGSQIGGLQMPSYDMPDYSQLFENLQTGIGGLGSQIGGLQMPSYETPDYSQLFQDLQGSIGGLGTQIGGLQMPSFEMPDYTQAFENLQTGIGGLGSQIGNMPSFQMPNYNQQFENLQQQIGGMGYGGPSLEDIQGIMPSYQGYGGPSLEDIQGIMPSYQGYGGPSLEDIQGIMPSYQSPDLSGYMTGEALESAIQNDPRLRGPQGLQGLQGLQGEFGLQGLQGLQGLLGQQGLMGQQGLQGLIGQQGLQGMMGLQGLQGMMGQQGLQGMMGQQGLQGLQGQSYQQNPYGFSLGGWAKGGKISRHQEGKGIAGITRELGGTGGEEAMMTEGNEQLIQATVQAILGMLPDQQTADAIIQKFIGLYGHESFLTLREQVLNPDGQAQTEGLIEGFGGGMDDFVPGIAGSQEKIATSPGEYIVPADVVSQLGDGNSNEGSRMLDGMSKRVRMAKTGTVEQAEPIDSKEVLPV
jgi:hypothetical protein